MFKLDKKFDLVISEAFMQSSLGDYLSNKIFFFITWTF